jgi:N-acetyl-gamma-glutamyl-phosphate reductase
MSKIKAGIINVTGYAGVELARLLYKHPKVELCSITGRSAVGQRLAEIFPHLADIELTITAEVDEVDLVFSAMPHKAGAEVILPLIERGIKVVDISADFRLKNAGKYLQWYDFVHPAPELLQKAVYGLPELHRAEIAKASLVANPGCYPTGALLALVPVVKEGLIEPDIIIDSKSGVSGAGRTLSLSTHYAEATDNVCAYSMKGHRHLPEIIQELETLNLAFSPSVTFLPHLVPTSRGILSSCYAKLKGGKTIKGEEELIKFYRSYYTGEPFVRVVDKPPETKQTWGSNICLIYPTVDVRTGRLIIISCLDNLVKGAAGQAIQNANIMFGFPETDGLEALPVYP